MPASVCAVVLNAAAIVCAVKLRKRTADTMHVFVVSMASADLLITALHHPYLLMVTRYVARPQLIACSIGHSVELVGIAVSGVSLTFLNVDKFIYFRWPLKYLLLSQRRAFYLCATAAGMSVVFVALMWSFRVVVINDDGFCTLTTPNERTVAYQAYVVLFCVIPVVSSVILSAYLYRLTHTRRIRKEAACEGIKTPTSLSAKLQSLLFIFATTAWTSLSLLPYAVNWLVVHDFVRRSTECSVLVARYEIGRTFLYLLYLNPIVNPLITLFVYAPYRMTLLDGMRNAYDKAVKHMRSSQVETDVHM
ncbi:Protein AEXR-1 [Aphelenchoides avenae]|nr:Protein AEXR-1 [Aphelenchus avenae]